MSNTKEVLYAVLHEVFFVPGIGQHGPTLTKLPSGTNKGYKMSLDDNFVSLQLGSRQFSIPVTNFKVIETSEA